MHRSLISVVATLCILFGLQNQAAWGQGTSAYKIEVGKPHADFELPSIDGKKMIKLSDFRGKKLLLFHFASW